ncbi:hypothetical protein F66182_8263 [Fusarium sp. NRRL 66182]|nr:hypothetical protein F66182_8263 [Fusarium sp. NRRL 66182]
MAPPYPYSHNNQQPDAPPPPYGYFQPQPGQPYQNQPYQGHPYQQPHPPPPPPPRSPRSNCAVSTARQFSLGIPIIIVVLGAIVSALWGIIMNISARRATHYMSHVPPVVNAVVQLILALGTTACFAILIYHMETYHVWSRNSEGAMIALLVLLAIINWILFGSSIQEIKSRQRERQNANNQIPI